MTSPDQGGWISYKPGDPIPEGRVKVQLGVSSRAVFGFHGADEWDWGEIGAGIIVAYLPEKAPEETEAERLARCAPELAEALKEAELQIVYLTEKFSATGTGNAVLARIRQALKDAGVEP